VSNTLKVERHFYDSGQYCCHVPSGRLHAFTSAPLQFHKHGCSAHPKSLQIVYFHAKMPPFHGNVLPENNKCLVHRQIPQGVTQFTSLIECVKDVMFYVLS